MRLKKGSTYLVYIHKVFNLNNGSSSRAFRKHKNTVRYLCKATDWADDFAQSLAQHEL